MKQQAKSIALQPEISSREAAGLRTREAAQRYDERVVTWPYGVLMILGLWLISSPFTLGYLETLSADVVRATAERGFLAMEQRGHAMMISDLVSGVLIVALSYLYIATRRAWVPWAIGFVGFWLLIAPMLFWAPTAGAYNTNTLIGALVCTLSVMVPGTVGAKVGYGRDVPPGWSYNPSSWSQRAPIVGLAFIGYLLSRYMAAYQLGYIDHAFDPFFSGEDGKNGTEMVLSSGVSHLFPVSDAALGAFSYITDALAGTLGGTRRWRTMPWIVILFGFLIVPPGVTSILLIMLQPIQVGAWCSICLLTAFVMLMMVPPAIDEVIASAQFLLRRKREGKNLWHAFWRGEPGDEADAEAYREAGDIKPRHESENFSPADMIGGLELVGIPWNLLGATLLGVWLMAAPGVLDYTATAMATSNYIVGSLVATFAFIAAAGPARALRFINFPLAAWILIAPFVLSGGGGIALWSNLLTALALAVLSVRRGTVRERYGDWDRWVV